MELLTQEELKLIVNYCGFTNVISSTLEEFSDKIVGYLGDHLKLGIEVESNGIRTKLNLFVKCMPRYDEWRAWYINELTFFKKEYVMLSSLFKKFDNKEGLSKWRPKLLFSKDDVLVFEDVSIQGYTMPHHQDIMTTEEIIASVKTMARFHAQSYIFEEKKTKEIGRPYRIWEDYSNYLKEPPQGQEWRDAGMRAVVDYLKVFSKYKARPDFFTDMLPRVPPLFQQSLVLMKPSAKYRNTVIHRDLWTNNILIRRDINNSVCHALFVDYQTVLYSSPLLDLSSLIYFNTSKKGRILWTDDFINCYYKTLTEELYAEGINVEDIFNRTDLENAYEESLIFALTQAAIITPIVAMSSEKREEIFFAKESAKRANVVSRSEEFIDIANGDDKYRERVTELFDEILERYACRKHMD